MEIFLNNYELKNKQWHFLIALENLSVNKTFVYFHEYLCHL